MYRWRATARNPWEQGELFAYAPDAAAVGRQAATVMDKILKGGSPGHLPVEQPSKFELIINLKTAKVLGIAAWTGTE